MRESSEAASLVFQFYFYMPVLLHVHLLLAMQWLLNPEVHHVHVILMYTIDLWIASHD